MNDCFEANARKAAWSREQGYDLQTNFGSGSTSRPGVDAEETAFIVGSRSSMHMMSKVGFTPEEQETITVSNTPTTVSRAF